MISGTNAEWPGIKRWIEERIDEAHIAMEDGTLDNAQTSILRGEIGAYRKMIAAVEPRLIEPARSPSYVV